MIGGGDLGLGVVLGLKDAFSANAQKIESSMKSLDATVTSGADRMNASLERIQRGTMMMGAGATLLALPVALVAATAATQRALGEVTSVGVKDLRALEDAAERFTNQWAGTTKAEFIGAAYDVKSALASLSDEAVGTFSSMAALTAKAAKATTQEMVGTFTTAYGIFKPLNAELSDIDWAKAFSGAMAQTVAVFKTTGPQMAEAIKNVGATAAASLIPLEEQLAILGQLQTTMPGSEAGTLYKAFIMKAAEAGQELGLSFTDSMGRLKGVIPMLQEIKSRFPDLSQAAAQVQIKKAFGSDEAVKFVLQMSQGMESLQGNIASVAQAMKGGTAVTEEMARAMNQDVGSQFQLVRQQLMNLAEILGRSLLPVVIPVLQGIQRGILWLQQLAKAMPGVTRAALLLSMAIGSILVVVGGAVALFGTVGLLLPAVKAGILAFGAALTGAGSLVAAWFLPVTATIGAVVLAVYGLKRAWETNFAGIRDTVLAWWSKIQLVGQGVWALISSLSSGKGRMSADLAKQLESAGLLGFVIGVFRAYFRVREFLVGIRDAFTATFGQVRAVLEPAVRELLGALGELGRAVRPLLAALGMTTVAADAGKFRGLGEAIGRVAGWVALAGAWIIRFLVVPLVETTRAAAFVISSVTAFGRATMAAFAEAGRLTYQFLLPVRMLVESFRLVGRIAAVAWDVLSGSTSVVGGLKQVGEAIGEFLATPFLWARDVAAATLGAITGLVSPLVGRVASLGAAIETGLSRLGLLEPFREAVRAVLSFLSGETGFVEAGRRMVGALARGLAAATNLPAEFAVRIASTIAGALDIDVAAIGRSILEGLARGILSLAALPERLLRGILGGALSAARWVVDAFLALGEGMVVGLLRPLGVGVEPIRRFFGEIRRSADQLFGFLASGADRLVLALTAPYRAMGGAVAAGLGALAAGVGAIFGDVRAAVSSGMAGLGEIFRSAASIAAPLWAGLLSGASAVWDAIRAAGGGAFSGIVELLAGALGSLASSWGGFTTSLLAAWESVRTSLAGFVAEAFDAGRDILRSLADGIRVALSAPYEALRDGLAKVRNLLPFSDAREGPLASLSASGRALLDTFSAGISRAEAGPSRAVEKALGQIDTAGRRLAAPVLAAGALSLAPVAAAAPPMPGIPAVAPTVMVAQALPAILQIPGLPAVPRLPEVIPPIPTVPGTPGIPTEAPASALSSQTPPTATRLLAETRGALAPSSSPSVASPGTDLRGLVDEILRKLDALAERPISLAVTSKLDGREIARAVYQDLRERRVKNYETL